MVDSNGFRSVQTPQELASIPERPQHDSQQPTSFMRIVRRIWDFRHSTDSVGGAARQIEQRTVAVGWQSAYRRIDISRVNRESAANLYLRFAVEYLLHVSGDLPMGKRVFDKADFYLCRGDRTRLGRLLRKHPYLLNSQNSILVYRAVWRYRTMLPWLLSQGVHTDCKMDPAEGTPLLHAAMYGDLESMRLLLDHGADPNASNGRNEVPLGYACAYEHWDAAKLLVQRGADVNGIELEGMTHLDWMTLRNLEPGIQLLRSLGGLLFDELKQKL